MCYGLGKKIVFNIKINYRSFKTFRGGKLATWVQTSGLGVMGGVMGQRNISGS